MTLAEVKALLGITTSDNDSRITALIPVIEDWVKGYCQNTFVNPERMIKSDSVAFANATKTITLTADEMAILMLSAGTVVHIDGPANTGVFTVVTVAAASFTVAEDVSDESYVAGAFIGPVKFPKRVEYTIANLINYEIITPTSLKQQRLGDGSETYYDGYPTTMLSGLQRRVKFV